MDSPNGVSIVRNKKLENSIKGLVNLYTVVIGAALSIAVVGVINVNDGLASVSGASVMLFMAFVFTLFPFFHGALRHLDDAYLENNSAHIKRSALVIDFSLLFLHALSFLALSQLLKRPVDFVWLLGVVLSIDVVWGLFTVHGASSKKTGATPQQTKEPFSAEAKWTMINSAFIALCGLYLIGNDIYPGSVVDNTKIALMVMISCAVRSSVDYIWCREIYFPK